MLILKKISIGQIRKQHQNSKHHWTSLLSSSISLLETPWIWKLKVTLWSRQETPWKNPLPLTCGVEKETQSSERVGGERLIFSSLFLIHLTLIPSSPVPGTLAGAKMSRDGKLQDKNLQGRGIFLHVEWSNSCRRTKTGSTAFPSSVPSQYRMWHNHGNGQFLPEDRKVEPREPERIW